MPKKYYAVKAGRKTGIFMSWDQCKEQVDGYSGALYKSFVQLEDAQRYLEEKLKSGSGAKGIEGSIKEAAEIGKEGKAAVAYVDGSYDPKTHTFSCGAVLFFGGEKILFSKKYTDAQMSDMRNVAGEIMGATEVIEYSIKHRIKELEIYHDYEGLARWANGDWKANKEGTKRYASVCREAMKVMDLSFVKVKGHSGDRYNDEADALAKRALGIA